MAIRDGAEQEQKRLATIAGKSAAQRAVMSGADLQQAADAVTTGQAVGPGVDGARFEQLKGGSGN